jgi:hypothetical protein
MLKLLDKNFSIQPIIDQVLDLGFYKKISLNYTEGTIFNGPYITKPEFVGTPLGEVLDSIGNVGEARLLRLKPEECYMAHSDPDDRLHLAITTNPFCYLVDLDEEKMYHLPVDGKLWLMDTGPRHVAVNFGSRDRIHLNIRVPLPDVNEHPIHIKMLGGDFDFKHIINVNMSKFVNRSVKNGDIIGFRWINVREIMVNVRDQSVIENIKNILTSNGLEYEISVL